jgi:hypothetical protein
MASVRKQIEIDARPEEVWDAVRDFGALHERLVQRGRAVDHGAAAMKQTLEATP